MMSQALNSALTEVKRKTYHRPPCMWRQTLKKAPSLLGSKSPFTGVKGGRWLEGSCSLCVKQARDPSLLVALGVMQGSFCWWWRVLVCLCIHCSSVMAVYARNLFWQRKIVQWFVASFVVCEGMSNLRFILVSIKYEVWAWEHKRSTQGRVLETLCGLTHVHTGFSPVLKNSIWRPQSKALKLL